MQVPIEEIWPNELMDMGVPVWGDRVMISPNSERSLTIRREPKRVGALLAAVPTVSLSGGSIPVLLRAATKIRLVLTAKCSAGPLPAHDADAVAVDIKSALEHYRSILDYLAHDILQFGCSRPTLRGSRRLSFPNAGADETAEKFERRFEKEYPGLRLACPQLFKHILDVQRFGDESWLHNLVSLVNPMKHQRLAEWEEIECASLIVHHDGVGIRLGELGLESINIPERHEIRIVSPAGITKAIRGPQQIDVNTLVLNDADAEIRMRPLKWTTTSIRGTRRSIAGLLAEIDGGVRTMCLQVTQAVHRPGASCGN